MEKPVLFEDCDIVIYSSDDEFINNCVSKSIFSAREIAWDRRDMEHPLCINEAEKQRNSIVISYHYSDMDNTFALLFIDDASIENSLNCLAACLYLMLPAGWITGRMIELELVAVRLEVEEGKNSCLLIDDSYNSDLGSLDIAPDLPYRHSQSKGLKGTFIPPDISETGQNTPTLYRRMVQLMNSRGIECIIGVEDGISLCTSQFNIERAFCPDTVVLIDVIGKGEPSLENEIVLTKGVRKFGFDVLTEALERKVHEVMLGMSPGAMIANLNYYRSKLELETKMVRMVKASAYGARPYEMTKTLQEHHADYLAVAVADEGPDLRGAGITTNVIIMSPEIAAFKTMFDYRPEPGVYSFYLLDALIKEVEKKGITNLPIHAKLDISMHRLGFAPEDIPRLMERLKGQSVITPRSVFSYLVGSDAP